MGLLLPACASRLPYPRSDHFDGEHFLQPGGRPPAGLLALLRWKLTGDRQEWPEQVKNTATPALVTGPVSEGEVHVTFVNHATCLIQMRGLTVLTDPIFSERASPVSWAGPSRVRPPGLALDALPALDVVVVGHNHYDHLDLASLKAISDRLHPLFLVPLGNAALLQEAGISNVVELDWWQRLALPSGGSVQLVPSQHWSARGLFDRNRALWGSYVLEAAGTRVFFAGDTGYGPHFKAIRERVGPMDVSLLPIGAYEPRWFMKDQHMNPADAVKAHRDLASAASMGIHFGTFQLTDEGIHAPAIALGQALAQEHVPAAAFRVPRVGETLLFRRASAASSP